MVDMNRFVVRKTIGEILDDVAAAETSQEKVEILKAYKSPPLLQFLRYALDPTILFTLPEGTPPFKRNPHHKPGSAGSEIFNEMKRMYVLLQPHPTEKFHPKFSEPTKLNQMRAEQKFVGMLESFYDGEAEYLIQMKDKSLTAVDIATANLAFPGLIPTGKATSRPQVSQTPTKSEPVRESKVAALPAPTVNAYDAMGSNDGKREIIRKPVTIPNRTVEINGVPIELTPEQWEKYQASQRIIVVNGVELKLTQEQWDQYQSAQKGATASFEKPKSEEELEKVHLSQPPQAVVPEEGKVKASLSTKRYNNLGRCKGCNNLEAEMLDYHIVADKTHEYVIQCPNCNLKTSPKPSKAEAGTAWRSLKKPAQPKKPNPTPSAKGKAKEKPQDASSKIIIPTEDEIKQVVSPIHRPRPESSFLETTEEDLTGVAPAAPAFDFDDDGNMKLPEGESKLTDFSEE